MPGHRRDRRCEGEVGQPKDRIVYDLDLMSELHNERTWNDRAQVEATPWSAHTICRA